MPDDTITPPNHDDTQEVRGNPLGTKGGHFGNEYDSHDPRTPGTVHVGQARGGVAATPRAPDPNAAIPPDAGARATIDPATGAVRGSGAGAGGGQPGEDFDQDAGGDNVE